LQRQWKGETWYHSPHTSNTAETTTLSVLDLQGK